MPSSSSTQPSRSPNPRHRIAASRNCLLKDSRKTLPINVEDLSMLSNEFKKVLLGPLWKCRTTTAEEPDSTQEHSHNCNESHKFLNLNSLQHPRQLESDFESLVSSPPSFAPLDSPRDLADFNFILDGQWWADESTNQIDNGSILPRCEAFEFSIDVDTPEGNRLRSRRADPFTPRFGDDISFISSSSSSSLSIAHLFKSNRRLNPKRNPKLKGVTKRRHSKKHLRHARPSIIICDGDPPKMPA